MFHKTTHLFLLLISLGGSALFLPSMSHAAFPLPHYSEVEASEKMSIDGTWLITALNKRLKFSKGRAYALDSWVHLFVFPVEPEHVTLKNVAYLGDGNFTGFDLPLNGDFTAKIQTNGDLLFQVGLISYTLKPVKLNRPLDYLGTMVQAELNPDDSPYLNKWIAAEKRKQELNEELGLSNPEEDVSPNNDERDNTEVIDDEPIFVDEEPEYVDEEPIDYPEGDEEEFPIDDDELISEEDEELEEEVEAPPKKLQQVKATVHGRVKQKKRTCSGRNVYLSNAACYSCPAGYKRASLTRKMHHPKACQSRGLPKHTYTRANHQGKARPIKGCPGKNNYRSAGSCYTCPTGFKRASLGRKMNHPQACQSRGLPKHNYTYAKLEYKLDLSPLPCPNGQFKHAGYCKSCPSGTTRVHVFGADTGYCLFRK